MCAPLLDSLQGAFPMTSVCFYAGGPAPFDPNVWQSPSFRLDVSRVPIYAPCGHFESPSIFFLSMYTHKPVLTLMLEDAARHVKDMASP